MLPDLRDYRPHTPPPVKRLDYATNWKLNSKTLLGRPELWSKGMTVYQKGEAGPQVDKVSVGKDGVGFAELLVDETHD